MYANLHTHAFFEYLCAIGWKLENGKRVDKYNGAFQSILFEAAACSCFPVLG